MFPPTSTYNINRSICGVSTLGAPTVQSRSGLTTHHGSKQKAPQLPSRNSTEASSFQGTSLHVHSSMICPGKSQTFVECFPDHLLPSRSVAIFWPVRSIKTDVDRWAPSKHSLEIFCWSDPHPGLSAPHDYHCLKPKAGCFRRHDA